MSKIWLSEDALDLVEYGLLVALIAFAAAAMIVGIDDRSYTRNVQVGAQVALWISASLSLAALFVWRRKKHRKKHLY